MFYTIIIVTDLITFLTIDIIIKTEDLLCTGVDPKSNSRRGHSLSCFLSKLKRIKRLSSFNYFLQKWFLIGLTYVYYKYDFV